MKLKRETYRLTGEQQRVLLAVLQDCHNEVDKIGVYRENFKKARVMREDLYVRFIKLVKFFELGILSELAAKVLEVEQIPFPKGEKDK